ncbi:hypothetical protein GWR56_01780 [Mucilaginibacter sp. 14171R-50]|uniref:class I mannose-6-phosphate isomerase n=1 Tax=Mucilaginibacter sp. 14171R-50 TaxID=2703789 RepID=UPI00138BF182|nr:class I mannose-6-phosphate isomerase [Mucilaginibacter sp. 14171R-50]QHS54332.1 hypothetical protein GWR56_01780 [Mucilaginibacter sp. 14171R-50]
MNSTLSQNPTAHAEIDDAGLRKTAQLLMPAKLTTEAVAGEEYNIYPVCKLGDNKIFNGYDALAGWVIKQKTVVIDGYAGILWDKVKTGLEQHIALKGFSINWVETTQYLKPEAEVDTLVKPFLGTADSVWGTKCTLNLHDLFQTEKLGAQQPNSEFEINIIIGTGASLANWQAPLIYIDMPKNELQFRMRAGAIKNLGSSEVDEPYLMYKRFYFVDWVLLNQHKKQLLDKITVLADGQWANNINWMFKTDFAEGLNKMSQSVIRVRPWFEPGAWGGQWIKEHIPGINKDVVNYAWSFELIVPENGLIFESDGNLLEASFDFLMFNNQQQVLGKHAERFGDEFPIRFDFLDTFDGGNLSIQCHPSLKYIQDVFGENITQDETYYILDCKEDANVYLGFQDNIDPDEFQAALIKSQNESTEVQIEDFVQVHQAKKHDLFLIPNGTIHSAGANNLVLEISATPYIFTFKMYDWLRLDLEGNPRPINIDHAFNNLNFECKGQKVKEEYISIPTVIEQTTDHTLVHLPTHPNHFYDIHRIEFTAETRVDTNDCCHIMMLVEGQKVLIETADGSRHVFAYAETFVIPAAAKWYKLTNLGKTPAKVIKAFLK